MKALKVVGVVLLCLVIVGTIGISLLIHRLNAEDAADQAAQKAVRVSARWSERCRGGALVEVYNGSNRTVRSVDFSLVVTHRGHSTNLLDQSFRAADLILGPKDFGEVCYPLPRLQGDDLIVETATPYANFQR